MVLVVAPVFRLVRLAIDQAMKLIAGVGEVDRYDAVALLVPMAPHHYRLTPGVLLPFFTNLVSSMIPIV